MNRKQMLDCVRKQYSKCMDIMKRKNHDYAGSEGNDPFKNLKGVDNMGICDVETGIMVRLTDKFQRLANFLKCGRLMVNDENVSDTINDFINYLALLNTYIENKK